MGTPYRVSPFDFVHRGAAKQQAGVIVANPLAPARPKSTFPHPEDSTLPEGTIELLAGLELRPEFASRSPHPGRDKG